jgi:hypothetical protein
MSVKRSERVVAIIGADGRLQRETVEVIRYHKHRKLRCSGVNKSTIYPNGHDSCTGCDCQHRLAGSYLPKEAA